jgi:hypothetical protein
MVKINIGFLVKEKINVKLQLEAAYEAHMPRISAPVIRAKTIWAVVPGSWESARSPPL